MGNDILGLITGTNKFKAGLFGVCSHIFFSSSGLSAVHTLRAAVTPLRHFLSVLIFRQISFVLLQPSRQFKTLSHRINIPTTAFHS
jgi:hypothetical protein